MISFNIAYEKTLKNEGGYVTHLTKGDIGLQTCSGISRKYHPKWLGWSYIDKNKNTEELTQLVRDFYYKKFWLKLKLDNLRNQEIANNVYDFSVNTGIKTAVKLAQIIVNTTPDGIIGNVTLNALNEINQEDFIQKYFIAKVKRYSDICNKNRSQNKFLLGWVNRSLRSLS